MLCSVISWYMFYIVSDTNRQIPIPMQIHIHMHMHIHAVYQRANQRMHKHGSWGLRPTAQDLPGPRTWGAI